MVLKAVKTKSMPKACALQRMAANKVWIDREYRASLNNLTTRRMRAILSTCTASAPLSPTAELKIRSQ
eukprot:scaffold1134_cov295-Prasinococcus_capsulatus_cf.AAC.6